MANREEIKAISSFFKVISDQTRLSILYYLKQEPRKVSEIVRALEMEQSAISHQLRILKDYRLVRARREGKSVIYTLDDDHIFDILDQVHVHINERKEHETRLT